MLHAVRTVLTADSGKVGNARASTSPATFCPLLVLVVGFQAGSTGGKDEGGWAGVRSAARRLQGGS